MSNGSMLCTTIPAPENALLCGLSRLPKPARLPGNLEALLAEGAGTTPYMQTRLAETVRPKGK